MRPRQGRGGRATAWDVDWELRPPGGGGQPPTKNIRAGW